MTLNPITMKKIFPIWIVLFSMLAGLGFAQMPDTIEIEPFPERSHHNTSQKDLEGLWELSYIYDKFKPFDELYPDKKPTLYFDTVNKTAIGHTGCNIFSILTYLEGNGIDVLGFMGMTEKWCEGNGEDIFLTVLKSAHTFEIDDEGVLSFSCGNLEIMKMKKLNDGLSHPSSIPKILALNPSSRW